MRNTPGQAGKEGPHLAMTGASHGFPQAAAPVGVFSRGSFLTCIQISQEAYQVVWYSHLFQNFPQFIVIHTVQGFGSLHTPGP